MPRYFFHCRSADETIPDDAGAELTDTETARISARNMVARMVKRGTSDWTGWVLDVADAYGRFWLRSPFAEFTQH